MKTLKGARIRSEALAASQAGIISGRQAVKLGMSRRSIRNVLADGEWMTVHPDVYRCVAHPRTWWSDVVAALLWGGPEAVVSHRTAAAVWGLDGIPTGQIEISMPAGRSTNGVISHRVAAPLPMRSVRGVRTTLIERTLFDLCASDPLKVVGLAMDDALRKGLTSLDRLWRELEDEQRPGRNGTRGFRKLLEGRDDRDGKLRSRFEAVMRSILKRIPVTHEVDHPVFSGGRLRYLDFAYPQLKIGIEAQSIRWHLGAEKMKADMARHRSLVLDGWLMLYYSWDDAIFRRTEVEREIRDAISKRSATQQLFS